MRNALGCSLLILAGCGAAPTAHQQVLRSFRTTVSDDLAVDGVTSVIACGAVTTDYAEFLAGQSGARECFAKAFAECRPAQVTGTYQGVDSGPFLWSATIVAQRGAACEIRFYADARNDAYGGSAIERRRCTALEAECPLVWTEEHQLCRRRPKESGLPDECRRLPPSTTWER